MAEWDELLKNISECTKCRLHETRTKIVPGEGSRTAEIMFIGEAPGYHEDRQGRPFVGPAGQLLNELLAGIGLRREDVYITNMLKSRPPNNRDPLPDEIAACKPWLDAQLELIQPKVIVTLGRYSFAKFFPGESISKARGKPRRWKDIFVYPMYHPAAALHNPGLRPALEGDFKRLPELVAQVRQSPEQRDEGKPQQLGLF